MPSRYDGSRDARGTEEKATVTVLPEDEEEEGGVALQHGESIVKVLASLVSRVEISDHVEAAQFRLFSRSFRYVWLHGFVVEIRHLQGPASGVAVAIDDGSNVLRVDTPEFVLRRACRIWGDLDVGRYVGVVCRVQALEDGTYGFDGSTNVVFRFTARRYFVREDPNADAHWILQVAESLVMKSTPSGG
eukprot:GHVU01102015.1.p1 GENE.GHVU01102015.1~~GHVU01102015.1.p1  ORF type:complete len:189 (+),score=31.52 GHVU01102015.1:437-1003(+)